MKTIFVILTSGFASRNVLQTEVFPELKKSNARLVFFVPPGTKEEFQKYVQPEKVIFEEYKRPGFLERKLGSFRSLNSFDQAATWKLNTTTIKIKRALQKKRNPVRYFFYRFAALFTANRFLSQFFEFLDWLIFPKKWLKDFFNKYQPSLLYSTDPLFFDELYFLEYAKRRRIRTVAQVLSWDNITGRGYLPLIPDCIVVWNEIMKNQILKIYQISPDKIFVSGIPQFDFYFQQERLWTKQKFCEETGLDPNKKIIVYTTGSPGNYPSESFLVEEITREIFKNKNLKDICQFYIRVNPRDKLSSYIHLINNSRIFVSLAGGENIRFRDGWNPDKKAIYSLAASLRHADVVLSMSSTIILEASIFNTPFIIIDIDKNFSYFYKFDHFERIMLKPGVPVAHSVGEVIKYINYYFTDSSVGENLRKEIASEQGTYLDGKSASRVANFILNSIQK